MENKLPFQGNHNVIVFEDTEINDPKETMTMFGQMKKYVVLLHNFMVYKSSYKINVNMNT